MRFDENGDSLGFYKIMNYRWVDKLGAYGYENVGSWDNNKLVLDESKIMWPDPQLPPGKIPLSMCSMKCEVGWRKDMTDDHQCCWVGFKAIGILVTHRRILANGEYYYVAM